MKDVGKQESDSAVTSYSPPGLVFHIVPPFRSLLFFRSLYCFLLQILALPPALSPCGKLLVDAGWPTWMVLHSTLAPSDVGCLGTVTLKDGEGKFSFLWSSITHGLKTVCVRSNPNLSGPYQGLLLTVKEGRQ